MALFCCSLFRVNRYKKVSHEITVAFIGNFLRDFPVLGAF